MPGDLRQVSVIDGSSPKMGDLGVTALMGANVQAGRVLSGLPYVAVEVPLSPHPPARRREDHLLVGAIEVDLGFEHPCERRRDRDDATGVLAVIGRGALEDDSLVPRSRRSQPAFGTAIRESRETREMTQEDLAKEAEITVRTLSQIETGNANPTWATVRDIAGALGVSISELAKLSEKHE